MNAAAEPELTIHCFERGEIDAEQFDHEAHVYVAWLYVREFPLSEAIGRFTGALRRLTAKLGVPGKYHDTISWFFLVLIAERHAAAQDRSWFEFRRRNDDLFRRDENILARYYSDERLRSERARSTFLLPDKLAAATG